MNAYHAMIISEMERSSHTGVIAQEVARVLPDAVSTVTTTVTAKHGSAAPVRDMMVVDKERIFLREE